MKRFALVLVALMVPAMALAQFDEQANINLVVGAFDPTFCAGPFLAAAEAGTCADLSGTAPAAGPALMWVVVSREGGFNGLPVGSLQGAEFGITFDGAVAIQGWFLCTGGLEIGTAAPLWPFESGSGNAVTWGTCYAAPNGVAVVGCFIVADASAGVGGMALAFNPDSNGAFWADCGNPPGIPVQVFSICDGNLGSTPDVSSTSSVCGDNCGAVPVEAKSWGEIKALF